MPNDDSDSEYSFESDGNDEREDAKSSEEEAESEHAVSLPPEEVVERGRKAVRDIGAALRTAKCDTNLYREIWTDEKARLANVQLPTTSIAICGATGAGKSSLLNAILDDNIVPTSGMHACTSVVTEIAYHDKPTIDADVSFLTRDQWEKEIELLVKDMRDDMDGKRIKKPHELRNEAKVAWQKASLKVHSVYPAINLEQLVGMTSEAIIERDQHIKSLLGSNQHIEAEDSTNFKEEISKYINATERSSGFKGRSETSTAQPALWPLIRQVSIRCHAAALETGAVLADLPGVADANAARNSVAQEYMKKCNFFWILAPITRAVDDKVARDMLNQAFKLQLRLDGNYHANSITFVATKTDDLSCTEIVDSLGLYEDPELERIENLITACRESKTSWEKSRQDARYLYDVLSNQGTSDGVISDSKKRKASVTDVLCTKKLKQDDDDNVTVVKHESPDSERYPASDIDDHIAAVLKQMKEAQDNITDLQVRLQEAEMQKNTYCSIKRSEYSREMVKQDFRDGIDEGFDGSKDSERPQDYDLPVFTCSSRDYCRMKGILKGEGNAQCFSNEEDTGIPALQRHCRELARMPRRAYAIQCLAQVKALVRSVHSYVQGIDTISPADRNSFRSKWETKRSPVKRARASTVSLDQGEVTGIEAQLTRSFKKSAQQRMGRLQKYIDDKLKEACEDGVKQAIASAVQTLDRVPTDIKWQRFLALVRRGGAHEDYSLNDNLAAPFKKAIVSVWETTFKDAQWNGIRGTTMRCVDAFLEDLEGSVDGNIGLLHAIKRQSPNCRATVGGSLHSVIKTVKDRMKQKRKHAWRESILHITMKLQPGYEQARKETGKGCVQRQRRLVLEYVEKNKEEIFQGAASVLLKELHQAVDDVKQELQQDLAHTAREAQLALSPIWRSSQGSLAQRREREAIVRKLNQIIDEINTWAVSDKELSPTPPPVSAV